MEEGEGAELETPQGPLPLRYLEEGRSVFLLGREPGAEWPVTLLREGVARLRLRGAVHRASVDLVSDPGERARRLEQLRAKYGGDRFDRWFPRPGRMIRLTLSATAPGNGPAYDRWLEGEFDAAAPDYEARLWENPIERWARELSRAYLRSQLAGRRRLLELGPGTGVETLPLLRDGHEVTAIDVSPRMLERLRDHAASEGLSVRLVTHHLAAREVLQLAVAGEPPRFDAALSTFGALNCEPNLRPVAQGVARLLPPGAPWIVGVFNRFAVAELALGAFAFDRRKVFARLRSPVPVGGSRFAVDFFPWSLRELETALSPEFRREDLRGFPVLLPPADRVSRWRPLLDRLPGLLRADGNLGRHQPFAGFADHVWVKFVRRTTDG